MQKIIWVVGCPRSGTTFITDYIGTQTDYCFNEPFKKYPLGMHKQWKLPSNGSIVFKYCVNFMYYNEINNLYPNSKWVQIIRKPIHVLYSMVFPKDNSYPIRNWEWMGENIEKRIEQSFEFWKNSIFFCNKIKEIKVVKYENIDYKSLSEFLELNLEKPNFINRNYFFEKEKMKYLKKYLKSKLIKFI